MNLFSFKLPTSKIKNIRFCASSASSSLWNYCHPEIEHYVRHNKVVHFHRFNNIVSSKSFPGKKVIILSFCGNYTLYQSLRTTLFPDAEYIILHHSDFQLFDPFPRHVHWFVSHSKIPIFPKKEDSRECPIQNVKDKHFRDHDRFGTANADSVEILISKIPGTKQFFRSDKSCYMQF